jgi:hypothetical protein
MFCSLLAIVVSCEEEIELPLADQSGIIVIEGRVTDAAGPYYVTVTKSLKLSQDTEYPVVKNATVVLKDNNGQSETLKYENGRYKSQSFITKYGGIYTLSVTVDGQEYTAVSQMPQKVKLNDVKYKMVQGEYIQYYYLQPIFTDPIEKGNLYLFRISNGNSTYFNEVALLSDEVGNGEMNTRYLLTKYNILKDDTVNVEMQSVDMPVFNYFKALPGVTLNGEYSGGGVPPANPVNNISNGALGYFSAHTTEKKTIVIQ